MVLPVFTSRPSSGFPVSARNAVCSGHTFKNWFDVAAVRAIPMFAWLPDQSRLESQPWEKDWVQLSASRDRFKPNIIDPAVTLRVGDTVLIGGYRSHAPRNDPLRHASAAPEIVTGHLISVAGDGSEPEIVQVEVPPGDYRGFSGGPAAVVDPDGIIRVWGVCVAGQTGRDWRPPWPRRKISYVARLTTSDVKRMQAGVLANPSEIPPEQLLRLYDERSNAKSAGQ